MSRIPGYREKTHQPIYDTLIRTTGVPTTPLGNSTRLFGNANVGALALTNMQTVGSLASDAQYVIMAMRLYMYFDGTDVRELYQQVASQLYFTLTVGTKPMFSAPAWYAPAGGGIAGNDVAGAGLFSNGLQSQEAILKLGKPITLETRQNFSVNMEFFSVGTTDVLTTLINGGAADNQKIIMFLLDGVTTRDVQ